MKFYRSPTQPFAFKSNFPLTTFDFVEGIAIFCDHTGPTDVHHPSHPISFSCVPGCQMVSREPQPLGVAASAVVGSTLVTVGISIFAEQSLSVWIWDMLATRWTFNGVVPGAPAARSYATATAMNATVAILVGGIVFASDAQVQTQNASTVRPPILRKGSLVLQISHGLSPECRDYR